MNNEAAQMTGANTILENLTRTLLYEGYSLYPYNRSAVKNQKPIPFGVVFPSDFNTYNAHAHSKMQTECIVAGEGDFPVNISVRFLHLITTELFEPDAAPQNGQPGFARVSNLDVKGTVYQAGWQTIERNLTSGNLPISQLVKNSKVIPVGFVGDTDSKSIYDENGVIAGKQVTTVSPVRGSVTTRAMPLPNIPNTFRISVTVINSTDIENAGTATRDDVLPQSFLSTHTILETEGAEFISHQSPAGKWKPLIEECNNINTWPVLLEESNTTLLSSPIIVYDYPRISPQSHGDLFDSTEIEEALLLHVALLTEDEKKLISGSDEKLRAMLHKVSQVTPEELINFHTGLKASVPGYIDNEKSEG